MTDLWAVGTLHVFLASQIRYLRSARIGDGWFTLHTDHPNGGEAWRVTRIFEAPGGFQAWEAVRER